MSGRIETYVWSADLGEVKDYTAVAALKVERRKLPGDTRGIDAAHPHYTLGRLERYNAQDRGRLVDHAMPGLDFYETLGRYLLSVFDDRAKPFFADSTLVIDGTGSGRDATVRFLRGRLATIVPIYPLQIRSAETTSRQNQNGFIQVARRDVLMTLHSVMDSGRLSVVAGLDLWETLQREFVSVRYREPRRTDGQIQDTNPRLSKHDDLALAVAQALWVTELRSQAGVGGIYPVRYS